MNAGASPQTPENPSESCGGGPEPKPTNPTLVSFTVERFALSAHLSAHFTPSDGPNSRALSSLGRPNSGLSRMTRTQRRRILAIVITLLVIAGLLTAAV